VVGGDFFIIGVGVSNSEFALLVVVVTRGRSGDSLGAATGGAGSTRSSGSVAAGRGSGGRFAVGFGGKFTQFAPALGEGFLGGLFEG
jgi:hypothetical protein